MFILECRFCMQPSKSVDEKGLCNICSEAHEILMIEDIERIQKKVGFKREFGPEDEAISDKEQFTFDYEITLD